MYILLQGSGSNIKYLGLLAFTEATSSSSFFSWDRRVRPRLVWRNGTPLDSRVVHGVTGHLSICMWNLRVFLDDALGCHCPFVLCLVPQDCLRVGFCHRVLIKSGPGNRGLLACRTTHGCYCFLRKTVER